MITRVNLFSISYQSICRLSRSTFN